MLAWLGTLGAVFATGAEQSAEAPLSAAAHVDSASSWAVDLASVALRYEPCNAPATGSAAAPAAAAVVRLGQASWRSGLRQLQAQRISLHVAPADQRGGSWDTAQSRDAAMQPLAQCGYLQVASEPSLSIALVHGAAGSREPAHSIHVTNALLSVTLSLESAKLVQLLSAQLAARSAESSAAQTAAQAGVDVAGELDDQWEVSSPSAEGLMQGIREDAYAEAAAAASPAPLAAWQHASVVIDGEAAPEEGRGGRGGGPGAARGGRAA